jgi:nucleoside-diphosphate-sugar epimerase
LPAGVRMVQGDVTNADTVAQVCAGAAVVYLTSQPPYTQWPEQWPPMMRAIIDGVARTQATLVFGDNLYTYGPTQGQPLHEGLPAAATGRKGRTRAQIAAMLLDTHQTGKLRAVIGRASDFYGPRVTDSALGERFFAAALAGKTADLLGNPALPHTYTYIRDFAAALVLLGDRADAWGQIWHTPNADTLTTQALVKLVERASGQSIKVRSANRWMVALLGLVNPTVGEFKEMMYEFTEPYVVDHSKFAAAFGAAPTPHQTALEQTVAWYRQG